MLGSPDEHPADHGAPPRLKAMNPLGRYARWLHTRWPAGRVERLPHANPDGSTGVPGVYLCGDLTGIPLLKFALDGGARVVETIQRRLDRERPGPAGAIDLAILGAGVSGLAAAVEARARGLSFEIIEAAEPL